MRRRRKRARGTWFPMLGVGLNEGADSVVGVEFQLDPPQSGETVSAILPVTYDDPVDDAEGGDDSQLTDFIGQEYILDRILGHWFVGRRSNGNANDGNPNDQPATLVTAGLFVSRSQDDGGGSTADRRPIGASSETEVRENYSPLSANTIREPWIWRRSWVLGTGNTAVYSVASGILGTSNAVGGTGIGAADGTSVPWGTNYSQAFPSSNVAYGSVSDAARVDSKTKRRVRQDERLWAILSCVNWPLDSQLPGATEVNLYAHFTARIYGRLVKAHNRSAF